MTNRVYTTTVMRVLRVERLDNPPVTSKDSKWAGSVIGPEHLYNQVQTVV